MKIWVTYMTDLDANYESSVFQWNKRITKGTINYIADIPKGTLLIFDIRSSASIPDLPI